MNNKIVTAVYTEWMVYFEKKFFRRRDLKKTSNMSVDEKFKPNPFRTVN